MRRGVPSLLPLSCKFIGPTRRVAQLDVPDGPPGSEYGCGQHSSLAAIKVVLMRLPPIRPTSAAGGAVELVQLARLLSASDQAGSTIGCSLSTGPSVAWMVSVAGGSR